mmetsp:Transcript_28696/g.33886  ORF Transcript_28696/g.33886 Transcript_28696/m.33886 type:complete len:230 (+) Transcript_28696:73-762(+)
MAVSATDEYRKYLEEKATNIIPYKMRRLFKMRDPYPVIIARNWARDMAVIECILCFGCLVTLVSLTSSSGGQTDDVLKDDDSIKIAGVDVTGQVTISNNFKWAGFALMPFVYKGLLIFIEILAVMCACNSACMAACCHFKFWNFEEYGILRTLGCCSAMSVTATCISIAFSSIMLLVKWRRQLKSEIQSSLLVMSLYAFLSVVLLFLRISTTLKAFRATTALKEEVITV